MTKTEAIESIIESMLKEHTGQSILDSGGAYGRNYEHNANRNFASEDACIVEYSDGDMSIYYNLYHFLIAQLIYNKDCSRLEAEFKAFADQPENSDESWLTVMERFAKTKSFTGSHNSYNDDNLLSQVIQYVSFTTEPDDDSKEFILLQIHGGCDVRGGYTAPRIFKRRDWESFIISQHDCSSYCPTCGASWDSDDCGYHWYIGNGGLPPTDKSQTSLPKMPKREPIEKEFSEVTITKDGAICPICNGKLTFSVYED